MSASRIGPYRLASVGRDAHGYIWRLQVIDLPPNASAPVGLCNLDRYGITRSISTFTAFQVQHMRSLDFARWVAINHHTNGVTYRAVKHFADRWPHSVSADLFRKAAQDAATTTNPAWAQPLVPLRSIRDAFLAMVRPATVIGKIPLRRVPFAVPMAVQTGAASAGWKGQGQPKEVSQGTFATVPALGPTKAQKTIVVTKELIALTAPGSDVVLRDDLVREVSQFLDQQFCDPAIAPTSDHPGSITNGITPIAATTDIVADVKRLIAQFVAANPRVEFLTLLMTPATAAALSIAAHIQTLTVAGGTAFGVPVVVSASVGPRIIAVDAQGIVIADDNDLAIDASEHATLQMDSAPTPPTAATVMVSLWQHNLVGVRAERVINWARASAVQYVEGVGLP